MLLAREVRLHPQQPVRLRQDCLREWLVDRSESRVRAAARTRLAREIVISRSSKLVIDLSVFCDDRWAAEVKPEKTTLQMWPITFPMANIGAGFDVLWPILADHGSSGGYSPLHAAGAYLWRRRREAILDKDHGLRRVLAK
jgi:hypothetical protein